jgi:tetratricopeptide (TPR) repeat protein
LTVGVTKAIQLAPKGMTPYMHYVLRGRIRQRMGHSSAALHDLATAIQLEPLSALACEFYNDSLRKLGRVDEIPTYARKRQKIVTLYEFHRKLDFRPDDGKLWTEYATHLLDMEQFEWSLGAYRRAAEQQQDAPGPLVGIARVMLQTGEARQAIDVCNRAIRLGARRNAVSLRGDAWLILKKPQRALDDFQAAQRLDDAVADAWLLLARQHVKSGDRPAAKIAIGKALEITPGRRDEAARLLDETSRD